MSKNIIKIMLVGIALIAAQTAVVHANSEVRTNSDSDILPFFNLDESADSTGKLTVLEGDVLNGPSMSQRGIGVKAGLSVWVDGIVPYYIDPELDAGVVKAINKAVKTWNRMADISLVEINPADGNSPVDYVHFTPANGCASWVGRQGGAQAIWTAPNCSAGSMMHEIGHALGLEHEHTRPDRDQHITINWDNVDPDKVDNFSISDSKKKFYGAYDYASIMHYGEYFFSATGGQTINMLNDKDADVYIGQRVEPSKGDITAIAMLYASDVTLVANVVNLSGQTEVTVHVTNEAAQGDNNVTIAMDVADAHMVSNSSDWHCATFNGELECGRARLGAAAKSKLVLILDKDVSAGDLNARIVTNSSDKHMSNTMDATSFAAGDTNLAPQPLADQQSEASAGGTGYLILSALMLLSFARKQL